MMEWIELAKGTVSISTKERSFGKGEQLSGLRDGFSSSTASSSK
jgi:hypothetical protein